jgi:hypothetical protein
VKTNRELLTPWEDDTMTDDDWFWTAMAVAFISANWWPSPWW